MNLSWQQVHISVLSPGPLFGLDHDAYEELAASECQRLSGRTTGAPAEEIYDPFDRQMGQMTVYRVRLRCVCRPGGHCTRPLPFNQQRWPAYMGALADSYARP